jgi:hypothetical protein
MGFQSPWWCRDASSKAAFVMGVVMMDKWIGAAMISQDIRGKFVVILDGSGGCSRTRMIISAGSLSCSRLIPIMGAASERLGIAAARSS